MPAEITSADYDRFKVEPTAGSHFSWLRTRLSVERTLMSWVRTSVSLIGFTIVQFFERFSGMTGVADAARPQAPRYLGLALIATGILALLISVWQYRRVTHHRWSGGFRVLAGLDGTTWQTPLYAVSITLIFIGLFAFIALFIRAI